MNLGTTDRRTQRRLPHRACAWAAVAASLLLPPAAPRASDGPEWVADLDAVRAAFTGGPPIETVEDLFRVRLKMAGGEHVAGVHLFGEPVRVLPYHNDDGGRDASGAPVPRGDAALAEWFPPDEIGFAVKHRRIAQRELTLPFRSSLALREEIKLHDSHLQIVVGVQRDGAPGVVTLSSPAGYEGGRFGTATYPMIFLRPRYPDYLDAARVAAFRDNIRTMSVGFASVAKLPTDYSGGDVVGATRPDEVLAQAAAMVRAIGGDAEARSQFLDPANQLYCAELGLLAATAGLLAPLNAESFVPLVGAEAWQRFEEQVRAHGLGEENGFTVGRDNRPSRLIRLTLAPADLRPAPSYAPPDLRAVDEHRLALRPMTLIDMIEQFIRLYLPREELGEERGAALQGEMLRSIQPLLLQLLRIDQIPATDPQASDRAAVDAAWERMVEVVERPHADAEAMRHELAPIVEELRDLSSRLVAPGTNLSVPPSLYHLTARGNWEGGLLGLDYVGHGLHFSLVRRSSNER